MNKVLNDYITSERMRQIDDQTITSALLSAGWDPRLIKEAFEEIDGSNLKSDLLEKISRRLIKVAGFLFIPGILLAGVNFFVMLSPVCLANMPWWCELLTGIAVMAILGGIFCFATSIYLYVLKRILNRLGLMWGVFLTYGYLFILVYFLIEAFNFYPLYIATLLIPVFVISLLIKFKNKFNKNDFYIVSGVTAIIIYFAYSPLVFNYMDERQRIRDEQIEREYQEMSEQYDMENPVIDYENCDANGLCPYVKNGVRQ